MNRGNMGKEISTAPKSKGVKKMMMGGMARPGMPVSMGPAVMPTRPVMGMKKGGAVKGYAKGGMASRGDGCCMKGKTKGTMK